ncbi:cytochrome P450 [Mycena sanguinolenta]|nr:cytochrome P450 [Mycena sanguinolenta]
MDFTLAVAIFLILLYALRWNRNRSRLPLPPGPRKLPLIGNLLDIPTERQWETFLKWSKQFKSDIIHLNAAGTSIVVLSSIEAVKELFEKRSTLYSDRPRMPMLVDLMGWDFAIGDRWRSHRKMFHEVFNVGAVEQFQPQELAATHELLRRLLRDSTDVMKDFRHLTGTIIMNITYGIDIQGADDKYIRLQKKEWKACQLPACQELSLSIPALKYLPNWIPGAEFKRKAIGMEENWTRSTATSATGAARTSFTSLNLRLLEDLTCDRANMYIGGVDTTVSAMGTFILAMLLNPEAQKKAQAEIDSVVGAGQLPGFADKPALPYVSAIVKEVLRWRNVTPIAIPHYLAVDDEYQGYRIPANSIVIGNAWFTMYPDPHSFKPERFLLSEGKLNSAIRDPETVAFGFGRRVCPGKHMAAASLWIVVASILSTFNIKKAIGEDGREIEPTQEYSPGVISTPLPFKCSITPRSPQAVAVIQATA